MARTPILAGNWKMNCDHFEANHLVTSLGAALSDLGYDAAKAEAVAVATIPSIV